MIDPKELRVGNIVGIEETALHADGCNYLEAEFEIETIEKTIVQFNQFAIAEYYKDLRPIQITEEWLFKFGFKLLTNNKDSGFREYALIRGSYHFQFCIECNSKPEFYLERIGCGIEYVHQLQNIHYALTGKELEIIEQ